MQTFLSYSVTPLKAVNNHYFKPFIIDISDKPEALNLPHSARNIRLMVQKVNNWHNTKKIF